MFFRILGAICIIFLSAEGNASDPIRIVGSSTVYPFAASVAEHFGKAGDFRTPIVEATGTGAGFKLFCGGADVSHPYVNNASRAMLPSEREQCAKNGVTKIVEAKFGFDGITISNSLTSPRFSLTRKQLFLAMAAEIPKEGRLVPNPYERWKQIDPALPDLPIKLYGTPPVSGTYDTFIELVMKKGCEETKELETLVSDKTKRERICKRLREDGRYIQAGENGNLITQKLINDPDSLGILGFGFLDQNSGKIQGSSIDGKAPSFESIQDGSYPISRPLYFYMKATSPRFPGLYEYATEFMSDAAIGDEGYLVLRGLIPLPKEERVKIRNAVLGNLK